MTAKKWAENYYVRDAPPLLTNPFVSNVPVPVAVVVLLNSLLSNLYILQFSLRGIKIKYQVYNR